LLIRSFFFQTIEGVNFIPLDGDLVVIIKRADEFKDADESITRNFDNVLVTTMNILHKLHTELKESPYGDANRQQVSWEEY
jgi:nuclear pore complex protein Nup93